MISDKMGSAIYVRKIAILKIPFLLSTFHSSQNVLVWIRLCEYLRNEHYVDYVMLPKSKKLTNIFVVRFKDKIRWLKTIPWVVPVEQLVDIDDERPYLLKVFTRK